MDMYDLKPDAPVEFRGEFKPIPTNVPGVQICEHFPLQAQMWDKLAGIRSIVSVDEHSDSLVTTGYSENVNRRRIIRRSAPSSRSCAAATPTTCRPSSACAAWARAPNPATSASRIGRSRRTAPACENLRLPGGVDADRARRSQVAAGQLRHRPPRHRRHRHHERAWTPSPPAAFDMVASGTVRKALDLSREDPRDPRPLQGRRAVPDRRRLVEAGVGCVTLAIGGWDTHSENFKTLRKPAAERRSRRRQPDPGPARSRHGQRRGHGHVGRVRPHAEDQRRTTAAAITGRRSCRPWSPAAA